MEMLNQRSTHVGHKTPETFLRACWPRTTSINAVVDGHKDQSMGNFSVGRMKIKTSEEFRVAKSQSRPEKNTKQNKNQQEKLKRRGEGRK